MDSIKDKNKNIHIGLVDADLLDNGTRHPNLALLKVAGFLNDNNISFELIDNDNVDLAKYDHIYLSKVFTFTKLPSFYEKAIGTVGEKKFHCGGTGFYATISNIKDYKEKRLTDMSALENDAFLNTLNNYRGGKKKNGIDMARQMPYYHLYDNFIDKRIATGKKRSHYKDYLNYSIGFLTRGCFRHCSFCVNKLENAILPYSPLQCFLDKEKTASGELVRPYIYLWDDNFLATSPNIWRPLLQQLRETKQRFQFRQGLDERILAESPYGEEIAETLSKCKYHGDYIFAFDNWSDRPKIEKALKIWKYYNKKETKFYLFCGYKLTPNSDERILNDVREIFLRIKLLMQYGCLGYIMRHEDFHNHPLSNIYTQIARWCNQTQFHKKMSFWEFCYRNQTYWEETTLKIKVQRLKSYDEFMIDYQNGYYSDKKICLPLKTALTFLEKFPRNKSELLEMWNYKFDDLINPKLWERSVNDT